MPFSHSSLTESARSAIAVNPDGNRPVYGQIANFLRHPPAQQGSVRRMAQAPRNLRGLSQNYNHMLPSMPL